MRTTFVISIAAALAITPLAFAHVDGGVAGTPKDYCEPARWDRSHDYGPSTGFLLFFPLDGNGQDCDGDYDPSNPDTETADYDGHAEFTFGGALLTAAQVPGCNDGAWVDHPPFPTVQVWDAFLSLIPSDVSFSVASDTLNNIPPLDPNAPNCGDLESDYGVDCVNQCSVGFPPGLDGTYQVYVNGVVGHVWTNDGYASAVADEDGGRPGRGCTVNTGTCKGSCMVNTGYCAKKGDCTVNTGYCGGLPDPEQLR